MATDSHSDDTKHQSSTSNNSNIINIGTRRSLLAQVQADGVAAALKKAWPDKNFKTRPMATAGDNNQTTALHKFNDKGLWTGALEDRLHQGELDLIVHCLKDMPTQVPDEFVIAAVTERGNPHDALVVKESLVDKYKTLADLPAGSVVGTSSLRRSAQMKRHYPQLEFTDVRGSVGTRLARLDDPESPYTAIVLAVAGLERLGLMQRVTQKLTRDNGGMLYAVGQGALAIEIRADDKKTAELLKPITCERTFRAGLAERELMRVLEGGCSVPIGVESDWITKKASLAETETTGVGIGVKPAADYDKASGLAKSELSQDLTDELHLRAIVVSLDGKDAVEAEAVHRVISHETAEDLGREVARLLVEKGAKSILEKITLNRDIISAQGNA